MNKISNWVVNDQPIYKLQQKGKYSLSDAEILSLIIGPGTKTANSLEISKQLLQSANGDINKVSKMTVNEFTKVYGIGKSKASSIVAAFEISKRMALNEASMKPKISASRDIFEIYHPMLGDLQHEEFWCLYLDRANRIKKNVRISSGGISGTVVDPKLIFKFALEESASSIIMCHNHPSGNNQPSEADNRLTKKIRDGGNLLDIMVLDHVIIAGDNFFSFADEGKL